MRSVRRSYSGSRSAPTDKSSERCLSHVLKLEEARRHVADLRMGSDARIARPAGWFGTGFLPDDPLPAL